MQGRWCKRLAILALIWLLVTALLQVVIALALR